MLTDNSLRRKSGDGIVNEVLNGLYRRGPDWKYLLQTIPLGIIPVGSGNGLARNIMSHLGERVKSGGGIVPAVLNVVRGRRTQIDLFHLEHRVAGAKSYSDSQHTLGFLSLGWGIMADIDVESENLRSLGEFRFTVYAMKKITERRLLKARLSYLKVRRSTTFFCAVRTSVYIVCAFSD